MFGSKNKSYEYKVFSSKKPMVSTGDIFDDPEGLALRELGTKGWELIGIIPDMSNMSYIYYFKRTK